MQEENQKVKTTRWRWKVSNVCHNHQGPTYSLITKNQEMKVTRKLSELSDSHYVNNQERTSLLLTLKRLQNHIFYSMFIFFSVQSL